MTFELFQRYIIYPNALIPVAESKLGISTFMSRHFHAAPAHPHPPQLSSSGLTSRYFDYTFIRALNVEITTYMVRGVKRSVYCYMVRPGQSFRNIVGFLGNF